MAQAIGHVTILHGQASAESSGGSRILAVHDPVFSGDVVRTQDDSALEVLFLDETVLAQGENSVLDLDQYVFDPDSGEGSLAFKLMEGSFRSVTGIIVDNSPENFSLSSPLATIGIRGTTTAHTIPPAWSNDPENHVVLVYDGKPVLVVTTESGELRLIDTSGRKVEVSDIATSQVLVMTVSEYLYYEQLAHEELSRQEPVWDSPEEVQEQVPGSERLFGTDPSDNPADQDTGDTEGTKDGDFDGDGDVDEDDAAAAAEIVGTIESLVLEGNAGNDMFASGQMLLEGDTLLEIFGSGSALLLTGILGPTLIGGTGNDLLIPPPAPAPVGTGFTLATTTSTIIDLANLGGQTSITLTAPSSPGNVTVTPVNGAIAAGQTLTIDASSFTAANPLVFDGSNETAGYFNVTGGAGADQLTGSDHNPGGDVFHGGDGIDTIKGKRGNDEIHGGNGNDILKGNQGSGSGSDDDTIYGDAGDDDIDGDEGNDILYGGEGNDTIYGDLGNDTIYGQGGADNMDGGPGDDTFVYNASSEVVSGEQVTGGSSGTDTIRAAGSVDFTNIGTNITSIEKLEIAAGKTATFADTQVGSTGVLGTGFNVYGSGTGAVETLVVNATGTTINAGDIEAGFNAWGNEDKVVVNGTTAANTITGAITTVRFTYNGLGGNDTFDFSINLSLSDEDTVDGGENTDTLNYRGSTSAAYHDDLNGVRNVEIVQLLDASTLVLSNDVIGAGQTMSIIANASAGHIINASAETDGTLNYTGHADNKTDKLTMGRLTSSSVLSGGGGSSDELHFTDAGVSGELDNVTNFEKLYVTGGNATLSATGATIDTGNGFLLDASGLDSGAKLDFTAQNTTGLKVEVVGSGGNDTVTLNQMHGPSNLIEIDGGNGCDTLNVGDINGTDAINQVRNVEELNFTDNTENVILDVATQVRAAGDTMTIDATGANTLTFDYSAENDATGGYTIKGTSGIDTITGGDGVDTIYGYGGNDTFDFSLNVSLQDSDSIDGGTGDDTLKYSGSASTAYWDDLNGVRNVENVQILDTVKLVLDNAVIGSGNSMTFINQNGSSIILDASAETDGYLNYTGHASAGIDTLTLGNLTENSTLDGGWGNTDTLNFRDAGVNNELENVRNFEKLVVTGGNATLEANDFTMNTGNGFTLDASGLNAGAKLNFTATNGGGYNVNAKGSDGDDTMNFSLVEVGTNTTVINGGDGTDTLNIESLGGTTALNETTNVETIKFTGSSMNVDLTVATTLRTASQTVTLDASDANTLTLNYTSETSTTGGFIIKGTANADTITAGHGVDTIYGYGGNDTFDFSANVRLTDDDTLDGGAGTDTLKYSGSTSSAYWDDLNGVRNVETVQIMDAVTLVLDNAVIASGQTMHINAQTGSTTTINATAETDGHLDFTGSGNGDTLYLANLASTDTVNGMGGSDTLHFTDNGTATNDFQSVQSFENIIIENTTNTISAGAGGSDNLVGSGDTLTVTLGFQEDNKAVTLDFTGETDGYIDFTGKLSDDDITIENMNSGHKISGGTDGAGIGFTSDNDTLRYEDTGHTDELDNVRWMENIVITGTANVTAVNALRYEGHNVAINASGAGEFTFDYTAETNESGGYTITGTGYDDTITAGKGHDTIDAGAGADTIDFSGAYGRLTRDDSVDGGAASDILKAMGGTGTWDGFILRGVRNVEQVDLYGGATHIYLTEAGNGDNNVVASGQTMGIDATNAGALTFNSTAETDGHFTLKGSAANDSFRLGNMTSATSIDGAGGSDTLIFIDVNCGSTTAAHLTDMNGLRNVETITIDDQSAAFKLTEDVVASGDTLTINHSWGSTDTYSMYVDVSADTDGLFNINAHKGDDTFIFGTNMSANQVVNGGYFGGYIYDNDTLHYTDDGNSGNTDELDNVTYVENIILGAANTYITALDSLRADVTDTVTIDATAATSLTFDYTAEMGNQQGYHIKGSGGNDTISAGVGLDTIEGNGGNDTFNMGTQLTKQDTIDGGDGTDTLNFTLQYYPFGQEHLENVTNVEKAVLTEGSGTVLTMTDGSLTGTQQLEVDASSWSTNAFTFSGAAETSGSFLVRGGSNNDSLTGGAGNDVFIGGAGADNLTGNGGNDIFRYTATTEGGDTLQAFNHAQDSFEFTAANFGGLGTGPLTSANFHSQAYAAGYDGQSGPGSIQPYFVYDTTSRTLYYDPDGNGTSGTVVTIATLDGDSDHLQLDDISLI